MNNTAFTDNAYNELTIVEKADFLSKLIIAAGHGYFDKCSEVVNLAQSNGLYERIKPVSASNEQIKDLDNPIN